MFLCPPHSQNCLVVWMFSWPARQRERGRGGSSANSEAFGKLKGKLHWPTQGRVQDNFGKNRASGRKLTNGVLIQADEGREVRSVAQGRVAYADWLRGYGMLLILDHGDGYMSLYGHNQAIYKELGEWVQAGEVIATVGKSGGENQSSLYFEIRHNGKPDNPLRWCRR